ncbi:hypothetical protein [Rhodococcus sp. (in: high G+C Gram-positive bacteria)]|uniref:hypothetical protein n=1 Tax=Rhodococcus sp. TaxID=1831 RepID=UPI00257BB191|nr:hypothetical protein [Rhodococcus sp. (in: high G+C Gram-positive bacteria)]MBQ7803963.1 hypothetical protein [Rhodococcus sp. (in: high G+C Gram-positive bacteria)]
MKSLTRTLLTYVPVILVGAMFQALLILGDPVATTSWWFSVRVLASALVLILMLWLTMGLATHTNTRFSPRLLLAVTVTVLCGIVAGIPNPILPLLVALISLPVLSAVAAGPVKAVAQTIAFAPIRTFLGLAGSAALIIANMAAGLLLGFFVTGVVAAAITWLVFGISATILAVYWASLHRRAHTPCRVAQ